MHSTAGKKTSEYRREARSEQAIKMLTWLKNMMTVK